MTASDRLRYLLSKVQPDGSGLSSETPSAHEDSEVTEFSKLVDGMDGDTCADPMLYQRALEASARVARHVLYQSAAPVANGASDRCDVGFVPGDPVASP